MYTSPQPVGGSKAVRIPRMQRAVSFVPTPGAPIVEPVTVAEFELHRRGCPEVIEASLMHEMITGAREAIENELGRALAARTITAHYQCFGNGLELPRPPLSAVVAVTYRDTENTEQTLDPSGYTVNATTTPGYVLAAWNKCFPATSGYDLPVSVEAVIGYGATLILPTVLKQMILLIAGHLYENREASSPLNIREVPLFMAMTNAYRVPRA